MPIDTTDLEPRVAAAYRGDLEITGLLGVGGFAAVFRAWDPVLQRELAIKVIDPASITVAEHQDEFLAEARVVATVEHPHIVPLYGAEVREGLLCLRMRLIPGRSLAERIASGPLAPAEAARIAAEVASALAASHARGVVHRDIKPENILLDAGGHAIVTDFGISLVTGRAHRRVPGMVIGTPEYLSPEQALGEDVDGRADVYALGIVLYEMLSGHRPFESSTTTGLLAKQILETPPPLDRWRADLPAALVGAVGRALAKAPSERPTALAFAAELDQARSPQALLPPSVVRRRTRWRRIRWTAATVIGVIGVIWIAVRAMLVGMTTFSGGELPSLSASDLNIPAALVAEARAEGRVEPDETAEYAFVPSGKGWDDGLLVTDRAVVKRSRGAWRRIPWSDDLDFNFYRRNGQRGLVVKARTSGRTDTLYHDLSGAELGALSSAITAILERHAAVEGAGDPSPASSRTAAPR